MISPESEFAGQTVGVVGSEGFIGKNIANHLRQKGFRIKAFTRKKSILDSFGNLSREVEDVDTLIWAASGVNPATAASKPSRIEEELSYWQHFAELSRKHVPTFEIVFLSSGGCTYSGIDSPFTEQSIANGTNAYGVMKLQIEKLISENIPSYKILRLSNVYGPGQKIGAGQGVIAEWLYAAKKNLNVRAYGSLKNYRDYLYISDLSSAIESLLVTNLTDATYNIGSGRQTTLEELFATINRLVPNELQLVQLENRSFDRPGYVLNCDKFKFETGWINQVDLNEGLMYTLSENERQSQLS